jgi:DNA modification methylase
MANSNFTSKLILGDNLSVLQSIPDRSVDLIYLDPPFFSNKSYEVIWGDDGEKRSFEDRFAGGIDHYISWLKIRVRQMHRILKDTGSIFLHCDWHASANIRVDILDNIFGRHNFRNELIWGYKRPSAPKQKQLSRVHDTIFWYSKSNKDWIFNADNIRVPYAESSLARAGYSANVSKMTAGGSVELKDGGKIPEDWWDIPMLKGNANETVGYPTQKPEALLERIIKMASNDGDIVLDPFVGGGTTVDVANRLNRKWIGVDQSVMAIKVTDLRLKNRQNELFYQPFEVIIPTHDYEKLLKEDGKIAEIRIVEAFGAIPNLKGGKDYGIDGHTQYGTPVQVKKWKKSVGRDTLDGFLTAIERDDKALFARNKKEGQICGFIIGFDFSKDLINEVSRLANKDGIIISLKYIKDIIPYDKPPKVNLTAEEMEDLKYQFEAKAETETGIDFYSWDFSHDEKEFKADTLMDKEGKVTHKFPEGEHQVAVEATDKKGLSGRDKVKIQVKK